MRAATTQTSLKIFVKAAIAVTSVAIVKIPIAIVTFVKPVENLKRNSNVQFSKEKIYPKTKIPRRLL